MKKKRIILRVESALAHASMFNAGFSNICVGGSERPRFTDGRLVTEANVTEFIRERTDLWRRTWIISPLEAALEELYK